MSSAASCYYSPSDIPDGVIDELLSSCQSKLAQVGQQHVLNFVSSLSLEEKKQLYFDIKHIHLENISHDFETVMKQEAVLASMSTPQSTVLSPFTAVTDMNKANSETIHSWYQTGIQLIAQGKVAALLMAGGQGTRLGSALPKGCYDIELLSHKSLFQLQAERIMRLREVAAKEANKAVTDVHLRWYVMTSIITHGHTVNFFKQHNYFGLPESDIFFFQQAELPALDKNGKIILESKSKVSLAPNGNGGIFHALKHAGGVDDMKKHGIEYIHVYGVDNVLVKVGDPTFIGFSALQKVDVSNKVVLKTNPAEKVGVMCLRNGKPSVVEYSELPSALAQARSENGDLLYSAGNIVQHVFSLPFLQNAADFPLPYHVAHKAIPSVDEHGQTVTPKQPNGIKLEMFVFDVFERAVNMHALAVSRSSEFSPVKNASASGVVDSPATARADVSAYHVALLKKAGAIIENETENKEQACLCEISPLVSYEGEGLEHLVKGKAISLPFTLNPSSSS